ncbi:MAG: TonB-dependent receptor [Bacteroidales bacterium]|nr:TonB-dependent receptor [Candidatus Sodaliphilus fimicaballi]
MRRLTTLLLMIMALCQAAMALDADSVATRHHSKLDSMQYLDNVVVYGRKPYAEVIPAQVLSGKNLEGLNSHSVADAIRYFSGVQIKDYGGVGGIKTVDIRSMGTNHMGVFYDGIQLGNAQNGQIDLGKFSLDNIEEISLYNGQKSDIFQPARDFGSAGTIYLRTRKPKFEPGKRDNFNFTMRTGSFGLANPSLRWGHKLNRSMSMTLNAEYTYATGQYHFRYRKKFSDGTLAWDTTAVRKNGDVQAWRVEGALFGVMPDGRWNAKFYYYDSERGIPGAIVNNVWKNSQRQWDRNFFTQGSWQKKMSERYETQFNAKYARDFMHYVNPDTTLMLIDNKFWQDEVYLSSANKFTIIRDWDVNLSVDYKWNYLNSTLANFSYPTRHTGLAALATAYTIMQFKAQASILYTMVNDQHESRNAGQTVAHHSQWLHRFTPAAFISYAPWIEHDLNFRAFYKRIFRMPTFNDLYYTDIGNVTLRPEYVDQYDIGVRYNILPDRGFFAGFKMSADAYYNYVTDKIIAVPKGTGQYRWMMMNIGKVKIRGIDVSARTSVRPMQDVRVDLNLTYTYQRAQDYSKPDDYGDGGTYKGQIAYIPWNSGSAVVHAAWRDVVELNYSFIYVGERYHTSSNIPANHEQPWYTHDISANYSFNWGKARIKLTGEVNNLLNQYYDVIQNYPMPGRNFKFILKIDI